MKQHFYLCFSIEPSASKLALIHLARHLVETGVSGGRGI